MKKLLLLLVAISSCMPSSCSAGQQTRKPRASKKTIEKPNPSKKYLIGAGIVATFFAVGVGSYLGYKTYTNNVELKRILKKNELPVNTSPDSALLSLAKSSRNFKDFKFLLSQISNDEIAIDALEIAAERCNNKESIQLLIDRIGKSNSIDLEARFKAFTKGLETACGIEKNINSVEAFTSKVWFSSIDVSLLN